MSTQPRVSNDERAKPRLINNQHANVNKDNWLGFVGDVVDFTGEVSFRSMLRIDGRFSGNVTSADGTLIVSTGAEVTKAVIKVAIAKINGTVEGNILASKELVLGRTANVKGVVIAPALVVEEGAQFNGSCRRL
ncbi:MAG TPA: polymer-forming cytoskeletal protein [Pyrinomonadaceae bacterium]|jgi:cytoskeletal protein CcmA (bactofilin family)|nr:polymer-forming cytoskeletal protein [Pyrinomonadaceae bacterium]